MFFSVNKISISLISGAYFSTNAPNSNLQIVVLNTNLYYDSNDLTKDVEDPAGQFVWLEDKLTAAANANQKVYIMSSNYHTS